MKKNYIAMLLIVLITNIAHGDGPVVIASPTPPTPVGGGWSGPVAPPANSQAFQTYQTLVAPYAQLVLQANQMRDFLDMIIFVFFQIYQNLNTLVPVPASNQYPTIANQFNAVQSDIQSLKKIALKFPKNVFNTLNLDVQSLSSNITILNQSNGMQSYPSSTDINAAAQALTATLLKSAEDYNMLYIKTNQLPANSIQLAATEKLQKDLIQYQTAVYNIQCPSGLCPFASGMSTFCLPIPLMPTMLSGNGNPANWVTAINIFGPIKKTNLGSLTINQVEATLAANNPTTITPEILSVCYWLTKPNQQGALINVFLNQINSIGIYSLKFFAKNLA